MLIKLEVIDLSDNLFNSSILSFLGTLPNLKSLNIVENKLEGAIHIKELNALSSLEELSMWGNKVTNFVPSQDNETQLRLMNLKTLRLGNNQFNSSVLASLGRLSNLKSLNVAGSNFTGSIDLTELNALTHLEDLSLSCSFSVTDTDSNCGNLSIQSLGLFPSLKTVSLGGFNIEGTEMASQNEWHCNFTNLEELYVFDSFLQTNFFRSIGQFTSLKSLTLRECKMNTSLSTLEELTALTHLEQLSLSCYYDDTATGNHCSLPLQSLLLFPSLKTADLGRFNIERAIMTSQNKWHNFSKLEELEVYGSFLQTNALGSIGQFISLKHLDLDRCEMNENLNILEGLCEMTNLEELDLDFNNLKGSLPDCFSNLASLRNLDLSFNQFSGNISVLEGLTSLKIIDLSSSQFSENIHVLENLTSIEELFLSSNQFSGNIDALKNLASLRGLSLSDNHFEIPISLAPLSNLSKLMSINAGNNIIYAETRILSSVPRFQLKDISLSCCGEAGSFPEFLYHKQDLRSLDLSNIFFKGNQFPNWLLDNNTKLEKLVLSNSSLSGPLELPLASHVHLSYLDISDNFFNGSIPPEIGEKLPWLEYLNMSKTHFIGTIPLSFGHMTSLRVLDLSKNKLEGKIFSGNLKLPNFRVLKLDGNNFSRRIPDILSKSAFLLALDVNNTLSGRIPRQYTILFQLFSDHTSSFG
ncbi:receptor-like protein 52 [Hibiscus syriacus]|uniref:receptor-like protein 52 n=1 Tax=Hibiscus syriacus TaxID=106335 RepID=UPI0019204B98|nr:receptor-like protein 52 [Hibiscus syriacus]